MNVVQIPIHGPNSRFRSKSLSRVSSFSPFASFDTSSVVEEQRSEFQEQETLDN